MPREISPLAFVLIGSYLRKEITMVANPESRKLFKQFLEFISQTHGQSAEAEITEGIESKVKVLEVSYENDSSVIIREAPNKPPIPYDCRHLGFRDCNTKSWKFLIDVLISDSLSFTFPPAYHYPEGYRSRRIKNKQYDVQWKLCDEVCKRLLIFFGKELGWTFPKGFKLYERIVTGPEREYRFKFRTRGLGGDLSITGTTGPIDGDGYDEAKLLSEISQLNKELTFNPDCHEALDRLIPCIKYGQETYGWSDDLTRSVISGNF